LLVANQYKINWILLSENAGAMDLLNANQDKIDWHWLSKNPNAIKLLTANQERIDWRCLHICTGCIEVYLYITHNIKNMN